MVSVNVPLRAYTDSAVSGGIYLFKLCAVVQKCPAGREIGRFKQFKELSNRDRSFLKVKRGSVAYLSEIERADTAGHTDSYAVVRRYQYVREGYRQKHRLLHCTVEVIGKIDRVAVYSVEELFAYRRELAFGVSRCGVRHIRILLSERTFGFNERMQQ